MSCEVTAFYGFKSATGEWRKLHNELNDLYCSPNIVKGEKIEKNEMGGACSMYGGEKKRTQGFGWKT